MRRELAEQIESMERPAGKSRRPITLDTCQVTDAVVEALLSHGALGEPDQIDHTPYGAIGLTWSDIEGGVTVYLSVRAVKSDPNAPRRIHSVTQ
jgi:hypothetical protein